MGMVRASLPKAVPVNWLIKGNCCMAAVANGCSPSANGDEQQPRWQLPLTIRVLACMRRYFFHLFNDETSLDPEGRELPNDAAALQEAAKCARAMAADSVSKGHLVLDHRVEVVGDEQRKVGTVYFRDVVKVEA